MPRRNARSLRVTELPAIKSEFIGYNGLEARGRRSLRFCATATPVESLEQANARILLLDRTSFYAESGGQIGDRGTIACDGGASSRSTIRSTWAKRSRTHGTVTSGEIAVGERVARRSSIRWRARSGGTIPPRISCSVRCKDVLGDDVTQAGSWVGIDRMRFDFRWPGGALTPEQKRDVAHRVNEMIRDDAHLVTRVLPIDEAQADRRDLDGGGKVRRK